MYLDVLCQYADLSISLQNTRINVLQFIFLMNTFNITHVSRRLKWAFLITICPISFEVVVIVVNSPSRQPLGIFFLFHQSDRIFIHTLICTNILISNYNLIISTLLLFLYSLKHLLSLNQTSDFFLWLSNDGQNIKLFATEEIRIHKSDCSWLLYDS